MSDPNTELLSTRSAPVTYSRSRHPTCSCAKKPSDLVSTYSLQPECTAARLMSRSEPEAKLVPWEMVFRYCELMYCAPNESADEMPLASGRALVIVPA